MVGQINANEDTANGESNKINKSKQTLFLKDYLPPHFITEQVHLTYDLRPAKPLVTNTMSLKRQPGIDATNTAADTLILDGKNLHLLSIKLNGQNLAATDYQVTDHHLIIAQTPQEFTLEIITELNPMANTSFEGLYCSAGTLVTQNEANGFRKITYFIDRPDVMSIFTTTIIAETRRYPVLLSNGNCVERSEDDGVLTVRWHDPHCKPCYLHAMVAGDLGVVTDRFVTSSGKGVALAIYCRKGLEPRCAHAMNSLKWAMAWDEKVYGLEYDLDNYMVVAVDEFNAGAMENKGLNVFNSSYIMADSKTATDDDYQKILSVIGHEYFHNWTGNRVTLRDWFQLSLKEGLTVFRDQQFSTDLLAQGVQRIDEVNLLRTRQFAEDAGPTAHAVRPESVISFDNFFTVTIYEKGAEVIRMIKELLGEKGFRAGMDLYFARHDGQAVTTDDFVAAMADANNYDFGQFKNWYKQAGTPVVQAESSYNAKSQTYALSFRQTCPATPHQPNKEPFVIPIKTALFNKRGEPIANEKTLVLSEPTQTFRFHDVKEEPIPSLLRGFSAPIRLEWNAAAADLAFLMAHDTDSFNRWEATQKLALQTLLQDIDRRRHSQKCSLPQILLNAFTKVLESDTSPALKARLLTLPDESYIAQFTDVIDVEAIHFAREQLRTQITEHCYDLLAALYQQLHELITRTAGAGFDPKIIGYRSLKNVCLAYLVRHPNGKGQSLAFAQLRHATNLTDELDALTALTRQAHDLRTKSLQAFYHKWKDEPLVMNKYFRIIATAPLPQTLENVQTQLHDPAFDINNPNKIYALLMGFGMLNPTQFHRADGRGYEFIADQAIALDSKNSHVASYLCSVFGHWRKFDGPRQHLMKMQMQKILAQPSLSSNSYEIISKGLSS